LLPITEPTKTSDAPPGEGYDPDVTELTTDRLRLRQWREDDLAPFAALNADPEVMRYFPARMTRVQSDEFAGYVSAAIEENGWGLWAVEVCDGPPFIGFVGLNRASFESHFTPAVEVGWRLAREHWGNGYATEAAAASLSFGFEQVGLDEIVSFTAEVNQRSVRVMRRLGMTYDVAGNFDHPRVADGPLRRHVLYRISKDQWHRDQARTQLDG
jgi:RimJ/RimL family protein N-acetyltransferase